MEITQIKETCLYVQDLEVSYRFYNGVMNFPMISREEGRHIFFRAGRSVLLCFIAEATAKDQNLPPHYGNGTLHLAFEVQIENYDTTKAIIESSGVEIIHEQTWKEGIKSFYFHDPDGHVLEIVPTGMWDQIA